MNIKSYIFALCSLILVTGCDDNTDTLGSSLTNDMDNLEISTGIYDITTRSVAAGSLVMPNNACYLGAIRDPETNDRISAHYMTQFHTLEDYKLPDLNKILSLNDEGEIIADSCEIRIYWNACYGDSLSSLKLTAHEMGTPMTEDQVYRTDFDPKAQGFLRGADDHGLTATKVYTLEDLTIPEITREDKTYSKSVRLKLDQPYTDRDGRVYNNYGTYVMRKYYKEYGGNPENFKNSMKLTHNVMPGFYFESTGGLGNIAEIGVTQLNFFFKYKGKIEDRDTVYIGTTSFAGTQEVLQRTHFVNEENSMNELINSRECTYLKTPAGIFTEITIPVDDVIRGHENDTINSAKFVLQRMNKKTENEYNLKAPTAVLLVPSDSLATFFDNNRLPDNKHSYLADYNAAKNTYTFTNIGSLIKAMDNARKSGKHSENWNRAVLVPVATSGGLESITRITHNMGLTSTRLVGGPDAKGMIKLNVIYSKYE